jgi:putative aldouronate transport system permease protein
MNEFIYPDKKGIINYKLKKSGFFPNLGSRLNRYKWVYLLFLPAFTAALIFNYIPMYGVQIAFKNFQAVRGIWGSPFVGLSHFTRMFRNATFLLVFRNTLFISFLKIIIVFPSGIIFALFLNELKLQKVKKIYQTISYLPHFMSWIILAGIIRDLTSMAGPINALIKITGGTPRMFLTDSMLFVPIIIITDIWHTMGWGSIVYLAAITGVPKELYESAELDGAGRFKKMVSITIPSILPVILILFILRLGHVLNAGFDQIFNLYNPLVYRVADIIDTYVYRVGLMDMNFSYSTAIGLFKNVIGVLLVLTTNYMTKRVEGSI